MKRDELLQRIAIDPHVCFGRPCIRGTRIWVSLIVDNLADDIDEAHVLGMFPQLKHEDILAALAYAAELTRGAFVSMQLETRST